jgi:hypothetical protein
MNKDEKDIEENIVFRPGSKRSPQEVKLRHLEWAVLTQLDGVKTVGQIGSILSLNNGEIQEIFRNLLREELLEFVKISEDKAYVSSDVFAGIEYNLKLCVGPMAFYLMEEILQEMKQVREEFERSRLPVLIDLLSIEIDDPEKRLDFQRRIWPVIKPYFC